MRSYLIVANQTLTSESLTQAIRARLADGPIQTYVVVPLTTGTLRLHGANGVTEAQLTLGQSYSNPAGIEHDVENANGFDFAFVEIELKDHPLSR